MSLVIWRRSARHAIGLGTGCTMRLFLKKQWELSLRIASYTTKIVLMKSPYGHAYETWQRLARALLLDGH